MKKPASIQQRASPPNYKKRLFLQLLAFSLLMNCAEKDMRTQRITGPSRQRFAIPFGSRYLMGTRSIRLCCSVQERDSAAGCGKLYRARSRLYRNETLQVNMRLTAFFKLYKSCILLHRCNLKIFAKNRFEKSAIFVKIQHKICKFRKIKFANFSILPNFKNYSLIIW